MLRRVVCNKCGKVKVAWMPKSRSVWTCLDCQLKDEELWLRDKKRIEQQQKYRQYKRATLKPLTAPEKVSLYCLMRFDCKQCKFAIWEDFKDVNGITTFRLPTSCSYKKI